MQNLQFVAGFDSNARFVHLFHVETSDLLVNCAELLGETLGSYTHIESDSRLLGETLGSYTHIESDSRLLRATYAECLFTAKPQDCTVISNSGVRCRFRFEKVVHVSGQILRPDDEIVVIGLITKAPEPAELTQRERQIVKLICQDMSNAEIARELKIKASTVETHRQNIRQKLGVKGTGGLVLYALRQGVVD
jgi:DNA-binding CsgD family transcriptional regulator